LLKVNSILDRLITRRRTLQLGLATLAGMSTIVNHHLASSTPTSDFTIFDSAPLKERASVKGLIYGAAIRHDHLATDAQLASSVIQECGMLVPEWALKWSTPDQPLRPSPDSFDFRAADQSLEFAQANSLLFRGHTLVWHESLPDWFSKTVNRENAREFLATHIQTVLGRYAGKIHSWDVVNEAINPTDGRSDGLRSSPWLELLGPSYIDLAFRLCYQADPNALLVYNDYGLDYDTDEAEAKRTAVLQLLRYLKSQGTPIHALGIQAHLSGSETRFNPQKLQDFLRNIASLGLKIIISELDVTDKNLTIQVQLRDRIIAKVYEDYLTVVLMEPAVIAVITWGLSDRYTWLSEFQPRSDRAPVRPLPIDAQMQRKLAWSAIARAFDGANIRPQGS
jgi:endo-1,4-beta-xylanase